MNALRLNGVISADLVFISVNFYFFGWRYINYSKPVKCWDWLNLDENSQLLVHANLIIKCYRTAYEWITDDEVSIKYQMSFVLRFKVSLLSFKWVLICIAR